MFKHFLQFLWAVMRRQYSWIGVPLTLGPLVLYLLPAQDTAKVWTLIGTRNYVYIAVVGGLLLFWSCFRAWDEQRESAESVAPEGMRVTIKNLESQLQDLHDRIPRMRILTADQRERFKKAFRGTASPSLWRLSLPSGRFGSRELHEPAYLDVSQQQRARR